MATQKINDILGPDWIAEQERYYLYRSQNQEPFENDEQICEKHKESVTGYRRCSTKRCSFALNKIEEAYFEYIRGNTVEVIRSCYHESAKEYLPLLKAWSFPIVKKYYEQVLPSTAREYKKYDEAIVTQSSTDKHYCRMEYEIVNVPWDIEIHLEKILFAAIISGDWDIVADYASSYPLPAKSERPLRFRTGLVLLDIIAGRMEAAKNRMNNEPPGYAADPPPMRREFLHGLINHDIEMIIMGLKKTNTRFKGMWDEKKYKKAWDTQSKWRRIHPDWESFWKANKRGLVGLNWLMSDYAISCCRLAARQGMGELLNNPKLFSEWVPYELVKD